MKSATSDRPKCLVELAGRSLLQWQTSALRMAGIDEIAVVTGYKSEMIEDQGLKCFHNSQWSETNMVASLFAADDWLSRSPCIVSYADIFYPAATVKRLIENTHKFLISYDPDWLSLWQGRFSDPLSDAETFRQDDTGRLIEIGNKPDNLSQIEGQYMGLLKLTPQAWQSVKTYASELSHEEFNRLDMTGLLSQLIARGERIYAVPTDPGWGEVDNENDLAHYQDLILNGKLVMPSSE